MDSKKIEELLHKYWNCETSLEEEQQLRDYFRSAEVPDSQKETAALFNFFSEQKKRSLNDVSFEGEVMTRINKPQGRMVKFFRNSMRIAAGIVVLMAAVWFVHTEVRENTPQEMVDTYDDPKMAFEETKRALLMISKSFGKAEEQAKKINLFNEAQEKVQSPETGTDGKSRL